ncbi:chromate transporter [Fusobacterium perfoetens]|uniref:chromate transporter n=1 Tax=Fusobacterium perfoetens TaxID=852 RepID=UPI001F25B49C|nr:chromate transporter [Fusobacterium perfoetens]MCF2625903.1 chromate transporter [Fusobacterium perfoetens]
MKKSVYFELFLVFFKIGAFTIGGGYAMVPLIKEALVDKKKWLNDEEFVDGLAVAQSAPGILAVNTAIITGNKIAGPFGTIAGTLGAVLPSFLMILALATFLSGVRDSKIFISFFNGIKPVTVALIFISVIKMAKSTKINMKTAIIPLGVGILVAYTPVSPIVVIIFAMILGNVYFKIKDKNIEKRGGKK